MEERKRSTILPIFITVFIDMVGFGIVIPIFAPLFLETDILLPPEYSLQARTLMLGLL